MKLIKTWKARRWGGRSLGYKEAQNYNLFLPEGITKGLNRRVKDKKTIDKKTIDKKRVNKK